MSDIVIKAENIGKKYLIGHQAERGSYTALRDVVMQNARTLWSKTKDLATGKPIIPGDTMEEVWALKGVSFEIHRGEAVGIIGRNGAGKSTLLKILSRITEPSTGRVTIKGRVASLLEVGTGFHPELTGRENIYLNGAILGMTRAEIKRKFDDIVAFAEMEKFLDTPVKRYSSGMYVRLAFAVAAHLEPEILLVDEVLAVGDAQFQKKCLGKMGEVAEEGRTVLFVSHNMAAMKALCTRAMLLRGGMVQLDDSADLTVSRYLNERASGYYVAPTSKAGAPHVARLWFSDTDGVAKERFRNGEPLVVNAEVDNVRNETLKLELAFFDGGGYKLWHFTHEDHNLPPITSRPKARVCITFFVPTIQLHEVFVHVGLRVKGYPVTHYADHINEGLRYLIEEPDEDTYRPLDSLFSCPVEFRVTSHE
jgi:ABC-type polysaccharide/polyol phosphate transport system ATPase subunit